MKKILLVGLVLLAAAGIILATGADRSLVTVGGGLMGFYLIFRIFQMMASRRSRPARVAVLSVLLLVSGAFILVGARTSAPEAAAETEETFAGVAGAERAAEVADPSEEQEIVISRERLDTPFRDRLLGVGGILALLALAWCLSAKRRKIRWRPVIWGLILQICFAFIVLSETAGRFFFTVVDGGVGRLLAFSEEGAAFVFGKLAYGPVDPRGLGQGMFFFFSVLPTIIFFSSLMTLLYHLGVMGWIVKVFARVMQKTMKTSGSESLSAAANIFVGQTEAPLVVKPFVKNMTVSELHAVMVGGFATIAGGVMAAYVVFMRDFIPNIAGHLVTASIMSAPAALAVSKIVYPETEESVTKGDLKVEIEKPDANVVEAAARGATEGMTLMLNVAAMLVAFVALVAMANYALERFSDLVNLAAGRNPYVLRLDRAEIAGIAPGDRIEVALEHRKVVHRVRTVEEQTGAVRTNRRAPQNYRDQDWRLIRDDEVIREGEGLEATRGLFFVNLSILFGWIFAPIAWVMGVPWVETAVIGRLMGEKIVLTEFIAFMNLADVLREGYRTASGAMAQLSPRSAVIASYALCGFANFASIGIQIGGIGGISPPRRGDLARIGLRAMFAGVIASFLTGTIVGIII